MAAKAVDQARLFFVEDDLSLMNGLSFALRKQGYEVVTARTLLEAEARWEEGPYDLVDVSLPDGSGYSLCERIRQTSTVPVMFLTAADEETDIIMGLDIGGDDYITKPFKLAVFLSRVKALLRRSGAYNQAEAVLHAGDISVHRLRHEAYKNGAPLELTASEYKLLCYFMENPDQVLSPEQILGQYLDSSTLTVYIRRLRMKIEDDPSAPTHIVTVRGLGYKWQTGERER